MTRKGVTRIVFVWGSAVLGFLTLMLGIALFVPSVPQEKMHVLSLFIPLAFGALGGVKGWQRHTEAKEQIHGSKENEQAL